VRKVLIVVTALIASPAFAQNLSKQLPPLERGIFDEINRLRASPSDYASLVKKWRIPDETSFSNEDGVRVLDEAVSELQAIRLDRGELILSRGLSRSAADHVRDSGGRGLVGHTGPDGSSFQARIERYGAWSGSSAENIAYGLKDPRELVIALLVDYGVKDRGHRKNLLNPFWHYVGIACGPHTVFGTMCVIDFAASYRDFTASN
jgi:uncharacterized protein YkwD